MGDRSLLDRAAVALDNVTVIGEWVDDPALRIQMGAVDFKAVQTQQAYMAHAEALASVAAARALERIADRLDTICEVLSSNWGGAR